MTGLIFFSFFDTAFFLGKRSEADRAFLPRRADLIAIGKRESCPLSVVCCR